MMNSENKLLFMGCVTFFGENSERRGQSRAVPIFSYLL